MSRSDVPGKAANFPVWPIVALGATLAITGQTAGAQILSAEEIIGKLRNPPVVTEIGKDGFTIPETSGYVSLPSILFDLNSARLREASIAQLEEVAKAVRTFITEGVTLRGPVVVKKEAKPDTHSEPSSQEDAAPPKEPFRILVEGHTCDLGSDSHNLQLSHKRAESVRRFLMEREVPSSNIVVRGHGEMRPVVENSSEANRRLNRRVDFVLLIRSAALPKNPPATRAVFPKGRGDQNFILAHLEIVAGGASVGRIISPGDEITLKTGDRFRIVGETLRGCHSFVLMQTSQGELLWLLPEQPSQVGVWRYQRQEWSVPLDSDEVFSLDSTTGREIVYVVGTPSPIDNVAQLEQALSSGPTSLRAIGGTPAELSVFTINHVN